MTKSSSPAAVGLPNGARAGRGKLRKVLVKQSEVRKFRFGNNQENPWNDFLFMLKKRGVYLFISLQKVDLTKRSLILVLVD